MRQPVIDPSRMKALRDIAQREKAALDVATTALNADIEAAARISRRVLELKRDLRPRGPGKEQLAIATREKAELDERIAERSQTAEIQRERQRAATRLRTRCLEYQREIEA